MVGSTISVYLDPESLRWLEKQKNRSIAINKMIKEQSLKDSNIVNLRKMVTLLESNRTKIETEINEIYEKMKILSEKEEEIQNAEKERIVNLLAERDRAKKEKHKKIESSPYFKDIQKMKEYDDATALKIIEKCRNAGNRDFGTYDIKEYLEARK